MCGDHLNAEGLPAKPFGAGAVLTSEQVRSLVDSLDKKYNPIYSKDED